MSPGVRTTLSLNVSEAADRVSCHVRSWGIRTRSRTCANRVRTLKEPWLHYDIIYIVVCLIPFFLWTFLENHWKKYSKREHWSIREECRLIPWHTICLINIHKNFFKIHNVEPAGLWLPLGKATLVPLWNAFFPLWSRCLFKLTMSHAWILLLEKVVFKRAP